MMAFFILFVILSTGGVCYAAFSSHRYEEAVPVTGMSIALVLFLSGIGGFLKLGVYAVCVISAALYAVSAVQVIRKKSYAAFFKRLLTPGALFYAAMFAALAVWDKNRMVYHMDEFSHWTDVVKTMTLTDVVSTDPLARSLYQSYVPGMSLFQYFVQKIMQMFGFVSEYREWLVCYAFHLLSLSFVFPFFSRMRFSRFLSSAVLAVTVCLVPAAYYDFLGSTLIEPFLGIVAGSGFAYLYAKKEKDALHWLHLCLTLTALVLAKDVGLLLAICLGAAMVMDVLLFQKGKEEHPEHWLRMLCPVLAIALPKLLWNASIRAHEAHVSFAPIKLSSLAHTFSDYRVQVFQKYFRAFFTWTQPFGVFGLKLTYPILGVALMMLLFGLHRAFAKWADEDQDRRKMILFVIALQTCIYTAGMSVIYALKFSQEEALALASFHRYLNVPFLALGVMCALLTLESIQHTPEKWYSTGSILLCVVMIFSSPVTVYDYMTRASISPSIEARQSYTEAVQKVHNAAGDHQARVYIVVQGDNSGSGYEYLLLRYELRPLVGGASSYNFAADGWLEGAEKNVTVKSAEAWREELKQYDYVLCYMLDESFSEDYGTLFASMDDIAERSVYRVDHDTGLLVLCE